MDFATLGEDGLIYLGMTPPTTTTAFRKRRAVEPSEIFYALQLQDGYLMSVFNFGEGVKSVVHENVGRLNDGKTHNVTIRTKSNVLKIWVDTTRKEESISDLELSEPVFSLRAAYGGGVPLRTFVPSVYVLSNFFSVFFFSY